MAMRGPLKGGDKEHAGYYLNEMVIPPRTLLDAGLEPAPRRSSGPSWREFLQAQAASIVACDFFTVESLFVPEAAALPGA